MKKMIFSALVFMFSISSAMAEGEIDSRLSAFLVTENTEGEEVLTAATAAEPGDTLEYHLVYTNKSDTPFQKLVINGMVPANTAYVANSSQSKVKHDLTVSFDRGGHYQAEPAKRTVKNADGLEEQVVVPASEYTHLRWKSLQAIQPAQQQTYSYRVRVK